MSRSSPGRKRRERLQYTCLENPMDRGAGGLQSMGSQKVRHNWAPMQVCYVILSLYIFADSFPGSGMSFSSFSTWRTPTHPLDQIQASLLNSPRLRKSELNIANVCLYSAWISSVQLLSHVRLCDPMNRNTPGLPIHHQLPEFTQIHVHRVRDAIQPSHPLSSPGLQGDPTNPFWRRSALGFLWKEWC